MTINELIERAHTTAKSKGFWDKEPEFGTSIALITSELSEALEEARMGRFHTYYEEVDGQARKDAAMKGEEILRKPCGVESELADAVIRIADLCGAMDIDLQSAIEEKTRYNASRTYKHGKLF